MLKRLSNTSKHLIAIASIILIAIMAYWQVAVNKNIAIRVIAANILNATMIKVTLSNATLVNKATLAIINVSTKESNPMNLLTLA